MENKPFSSKGRVLALDFGKKRIGLALSDPLGIIAQGLPTLERVNNRKDLAALAVLSKEREVSLLLFGYPFHMSGQESQQGQFTKDFAERLAKSTGLEVRYWDERLTSVEAEDVLRGQGVSFGRGSGAVDQMAARILLESYLESGEAE